VGGKGMHGRSARALAAAGAVWMAGAAGGQQGLNDDFDCYRVEAAVSTLPGWELWQQPPGREGFITDEQAFSGGQSLHLNQELTDVGHRLMFDSGQVMWRMMT